MKFLVLFALVAGAFASARHCPANSHYEECGTGCPTTCDNYENPPRACALMCVSGCFCDKGYVQTQGKCVKPENCGPHNVHDSKYEHCYQPAETGSCRGYFPRFYYESSTGECKKFIYGGCDGNKNNFKTEVECRNSCYLRDVDNCGENEIYNGCGTTCPLTCENYDNPPKFCNLMCKIGCACQDGFVKRADGKCVAPAECPTRQAALDRPDCEKPAESGLCRAYIPRYYYDQEAGQCKRFIYGGCGGNRNNFKTEEECYNKCGALQSFSREICNLEKETGPCRAFLRRFHFNRKTGQCESFIYGGCQGNENNFASQQDCERRCLV